MAKTTHILYYMLATFGILAAFTACYDNPYVSEYKYVSAQKHIDSVLFTMGIDSKGAMTQIATRGTGPFDSNEKYNEDLIANEKKMDNSIFYVFGFHESDETDFTKTTDPQNALYDEENADCLFDNDDQEDPNRYYTGKPAMFTDHNYDKLTFVSGKDSRTPIETIYNPIHLERPYSFFGYYMDDIQPTSSNTERTSSRISYDITIDGYQDILLGKVKPLDKENEKLVSLLNDSAITTDEYKKILSTCHYSTYSAHRGIEPSMTLEHLLTRLRFYAYPGGPSADHITITKIGIVTHPHARFTVASKDSTEMGLVFDESVTDTLFLHNASPDGLTQAELMDPVTSPKWDRNKTLWQQEHLQLGESMMIQPAETVELILYYDHKDQNVIYHMKNRYILNAPEKERNRNEEGDENNNDDDNDDENGGEDGPLMFDAGYAYAIRIAVYGLEDIKIYTEFNSSWGFGGDTDIEPDNQ